MIFDSIRHAGCYKGIHPQLDAALHFLATADLSQLAPGRHILQENAITCSRVTAEMHSAQEGFFEAHRKFLDIHVPLSGTELLLIAPIEQLTPDGDFDEAADCQKFFRQDTPVLRMVPGTFAVCFPSDGHMPLVSGTGRGSIEKLIFKVRL